MSLPSNTDDTGGGGGSGSGGGGSTTSSTAAAALAAAIPAVGVAVGGVGSSTNAGGIIAKVALADTAVRVPGFPVPKGSRVYVRPKPGNVKVVQIATYPGGAVYGPCDFVGISDSEREYPVQNTAEIFIAQPAANFNAGDGIVVSLREK